MKFASSFIRSQIKGSQKKIAFIMEINKPVVCFSEILPTTEKKDSYGVLFKLQIFVAIFFA